MSVEATVTAAPFPDLPGLTDNENLSLRVMLKQIRDKAAFHRTVQAYYDLENSFRAANNGIIPGRYSQLGLILGWAQKGVDALSARCKFAGLTWSDGDLDSVGYREFEIANRFRAETDKATVSELIHAVSFAVATKGETGEPAGMLHYASGEDASGLWNNRLRRLDAFVWVHEWANNEPVSLTFYAPGKTVTAVKGTAWATEVSTHSFGMPVEPLSYQPRLKRWSGRSRINRAVRGLQRAAVRELVRLEGHMDLYSRPEFILLGADESVFADTGDAWTAGLGKVRGIPDDLDMAEADLPSLARADVKHFQAASPEPHLAALNMYAKMVARELALPDSSIAITDFANPTSGEAYDASQQELIAAAEGVTDSNTPGLERVARIALAMHNEETEVDPRWATIRANWQDPRYQSRAAQADAGSKIIGSVPELAGTSVGLELLGLSPDQAERAEAEMRRNRLSAAVGGLAAAARPREVEVVEGETGGE
jgi:hypothetical protein